MYKKYIEREAVLKKAKYNGHSLRPMVTAYHMCVAVADIEKIPAADVIPVVHGEWIDKPTGAYGRWQSWCSACGKHSGIGGITSNQHKPYCPNCGAKMDKAKRSETQCPIL